MIRQSTCKKIPQRDGKDEDRADDIRKIMAHVKKDNALDTFAAAPTGTLEGSCAAVPRPI